MYLIKDACYEKARQIIIGFEQWSRSISNITVENIAIVCVCRGSRNKREEKEASKERQIRLLGGVRVKRREKNSCRRVEGWAPLPGFVRGAPCRCQPAGALFQDRTESGTTIALISTRMPCRRPPRCNGARR